VRMESHRRAANHRRASFAQHTSRWTASSLETNRIDHAAVLRSVTRELARSSSVGAGRRTIWIQRDASSELGHATPNRERLRDGQTRSPKPTQTKRPRTQRSRPVADSHEPMPIGMRPSPRPESTRTTTSLCVNLDRTHARTPEHSARTLPPARLPPTSTVVANAGGRSRNWNHSSLNSAASPC